MPDTAADLSGKDWETATTVPSGALSLNLKRVSSSMKSSNIPVMGILLNAGRRRPAGLVESGTRCCVPVVLVRQKDYLVQCV